MGDMPSQKEVYLLKLDDLGAPVLDGKYIKLPPAYEPYILRFEFDRSSVLFKTGTLKTDYPIDGSPFLRDQQHCISFSSAKGNRNFVDIEISLAGAFSWIVEYRNLSKWSQNGEEQRKSEPSTSDTYYFTVEPALRLKQMPIPLASLAIQSVVSKWMGPINAWQPRLEYISKTKQYNMIHFTPLQQRGDSNSSYSLFDQNCFADDLFEDPKSLSRSQRTEKVREQIKDMETTHGLLSLTDVVWNHTANNSDWLLDHPEAGYNLQNSPHLYAAYALDTALLEFSANLSRFGLPTDLKTSADLLKIMDGMKSRVFGQIKLWEFYVVDIKAGLAGLSPWSDNTSRNDFDLGSLSCRSSLEAKASFALDLGVVPGYEYLGDRFAKTIDHDLLSAFLIKLGTSETDYEAEAGKLLDEINLRFYKEYDEDQETMLDQLYNRIKYIRIDEHGPRAGPISSSSPLIESYFTRLPKNSRTAKHHEGALALACNGWMWGANPLEDFASRSSKAYLRREVIVWSDCVKLRYGDRPSDNPYLWKHMTEYTTTLASIFHGFRIDNCHSTPIPLASYLLDQARRVRPDLYIVAELFTGSEDMDVLFLQKLGIGSLIREAMQADSTRELSRLVHKYGGKPIGSVDQAVVSTADHTGLKVNLVMPSPIHALFMDCTHDNETPNQKRCAEDTLPNAALVSMTGSAIGSVMGYDEVYPHILDIVAEDRNYSTEINGIGEVKGRLNKMHQEMGLKGYTECHIHHEGEYITIHRLHPVTQEGYYLIAHTAFSKGNQRGLVSTMCLSGTTVTCEYNGVLEVNSLEDRSTPDELKGLTSRMRSLDNPHVHYDHGNTYITLPDNFPPGAIAIFSTQVPKFEGQMNGKALDRLVRSDAESAVSQCNLHDLNVLLYRCAAEENDTIKHGAYSLDGYGSLVYCGLQGWMNPIKDILRWNDLGHALCINLRNGQWAFDYIVQRQKMYQAMRDYEGLTSVTEWLESRFSAIRSHVPAFLIPRYFLVTITTLYEAARARAITLFSDTITKGDRFTQNLALCSIQMQGKVSSASLKPDSIVACMAAGLPHFSTSWARCWGRDIFIALRGLFLVTGRHSEAKDHILAFATTLKHGMIPNLLDSIRTPRYNSRDSIWFYMQSIQDYVSMVPGGESILSEKVKRRFPLNDEYIEWDNSKAYSYESSVSEIIQETLQRHAHGIHFREANAGSGLDMQMKDEGFNIDIEVDWNTGIIFGGSQDNCGTWMDKMGESERAGSKGVPGTPRDGAAVEITGLLKSTLRWVIELKKKGLYENDSVTATIDGKSVQMTFVKWNDLLQKNFERCYYVPSSSSDDSNYDIDSSIVNRRGIYKDLYRSGKPYEDYQLRAQVSMAMVVAPELFDVDHALSHLELADKVLRGPLGMATLDPADSNYRPNYHNSEDSTDFHTSKGRNYHQGPEWVFPIGYFLRAFLYFSLKKNKTNLEETVQHVYSRLQAHKKEIESTPWAGLTELTNKNGEVCGDSSPTQAWSSGTLLDVIDDIRHIQTQGN